MKIKDLVATQPVQSEPTEKISASTLVHHFFLENNIKPKVEVINELNTWDGSGYILNDKPLLRVTYEYKEEK